LYLILLTALALIGAVFIVTLFNFITAPMLRKSPYAGATGSVSVLIPARNEEHNIARCLDGLLKQEYPDMEIIVLDDESTDQTATIIQHYARMNSRIKYVPGKPLPPDWTGKNWACHQLSAAATGELLIFTDADNQHAPNAITNTVGWMQKLKTGMLSAFPQQYTISFIEKLVVPIMDIFVYGTLPLWLTYYSSKPSLAAANGQWIAFTREAYHKIGGHEAVKNQLVEDTELNRLAKRLGIKTVTTAGTGVVFCRMYHTAEEVWAGFSKNFYGLTGYNPFVLWFIIAAMFIAFISPYFLWLIPEIRLLAAVAMMLNIIFRALIAIKYKHPLFVSVCLHPLSMLYGIMIGVNSFFSINKGTIRWKDRNISVG